MSNSTVTCTVDGILNIDKPAGKTSFDIVALVKRLTRVKRVGHAGTLDPMATGVLPVCLGKGTRIIEFLAEATKTYRARIELGIVTDTYDATGTVVRTTDASGITREQAYTALSAFQGVIQQTPPLYSAIRHGGKRLYELARAGITVVPKSRPVTIHRIELLDWSPPFMTIEVECSKGTYIRSLAYDLGQTLGCGATLSGLVRVNYGQFHIAESVPVSRLEEACRYGYWQHFLHPLDIVLTDWNAVLVAETSEAAIRKGAPPLFKGEGCQPADALSRCRAYSAGGDFLGVLRFDAANSRWQPEKVFA